MHNSTVNRRLDEADGGGTGGTDGGHGGGGGGGAGSRSASMLSTAGGVGGSRRKEAEGRFTEVLCTRRFTRGQL